MKKRLFIAIPLPQEVKNELLSLKKKLKKLNIRWTRSENLHFTLIFIGWIGEEKIEIIKEILIKSAQDLSRLVLKLEKLILAPTEKKPRMIWAVGPCTPELNKLRKMVAVESIKNDIQFQDRHSLEPHITLARSYGKELFDTRIEEILDLVFLVKEIYLMESELGPEGVEYKKIGSANFKK